MERRGVKHESQNKGGIGNPFGPDGNLRMRQYSCKTIIKGRATKSGPAVNDSNLRC